MMKLKVGQFTALLWPLNLIVLTKRISKGTIVPMKIIADTNTFLAVTIYEPERDEIIRQCHTLPPCLSHRLRRSGCFPARALSSEPTKIE